MRNFSRGFTLIEMVMVIVLLGIVSVGIGSFIRLGSQAYAEVSARDELIASARFAVERLNRELRQALPNSARVHSNGQCLEFIPIKASTTYTDVPVLPEPASNTLSIIRFDNSNVGRGDRVVVYPINSNDLYGGSSRIFSVDSVSIDTSNNTGQVDLATSGNIRFPEDSPTRRLYFIDQAVSYCVNGTDLLRFTNTNGIPNNFAQGVLMAQDLVQGFETICSNTAIFDQKLAYSVGIALFA